MNTSTILNVGTKVIVNGGLRSGRITKLFPFGFDYIDSEGVTETVRYGIDTYRITERGLSNDELQLLKHITMFGAPGYPIRKFKTGKWTWGPFRSIAGPPTVFKTKREAVASFEAYHQVLLDALAGRL